MRTRSKKLIQTRVETPSTLISAMAMFQVTIKAITLIPIATMVVTTPLASLPTRKKLSLMRPVKTLSHIVDTPTIQVPMAASTPATTESTIPVIMVNIIQALLRMKARQKKTCTMITTLVRVSAFPILASMTTNKNQRTTLRLLKQMRTKPRKMVSIPLTNTTSIIILSPVTMLRHSISMLNSPSIMRPLPQHKSSHTRLCMKLTI